MADEDEHHFLSMWISAKKLGPDIPKKGYGHSYHLVMTNSSPWYRWPIEIDGLPIKNGDFPWLC